MPTDFAFKEGIQVEEIVGSGSRSRDDSQLARLGKKPVLKRNFGFLTILGFSCTVLVTWEGSLIVFLAGLQNGGPSGIIYGYILVWMGTLSVFITLSELASMAPTSGGQYHWVSMLAPRSSRKFLGYITGWMIITGWQAMAASAVYLTGTLIQSLILLTHPEYLPNMQNWHGTLLIWGVVLLCYAINTALGSLLAKFEGVVLIIHILGFFGVIFPLAFKSERATSGEVFNTFMNLGGWHTQGLSFCVGILGNVFAFMGGDGAIHMSEEIRNAAVVIPRSLLTGLMVNGTLGFAMLIATLYCMGDIEAAIHENPHSPFMAIFRNAVQSRAAAAAMSAVLVFMAFSCSTGVVASASRVYWAFARDRGLPGWRFLKRISPRTSIPLNAVFTTAIFAVLLSLITIGDATAFNGVISISIAGVFGSYLMSAALLLFRRITGAIRTPNPEDTLTNTLGSSLTWGPWHIRGVFGIMNNIFSCIYLTFILFFSFWPASREVTLQNMNWSVLVTGVVLLFSVVYYLIWARHSYSGPVIETEGHPLA
ncbi:hypothetical protein FQN57_002818 [Myotisia sp. PD_48]|nr:hypothetical protein FQN57_002818 [Myotisia sp. PD_48]